jgi:hypothetical protein
LLIFKGVIVSDSVDLITVNVDIFSEYFAFMTNIHVFWWILNPLQMY